MEKLLVIGAIVMLVLAGIITLVVVLVKKKKKTSSPSTSPSSVGSAGGTGTWKKAEATWFQSYPPCCKGSAAYDPKAPKTECSDNSGCKYQGQFQTGKKLSYEAVKAQRFCAFYDLTQAKAWKGDKNSVWDSKYRDKYIYVRKPGDAASTIKAQIIDTCRDSDCGGCCSRNAKRGGGYLIDFEWHTAIAFYKKSKPDDTAKVEWRFA